MIDGPRVASMDERGCRRITSRLQAGTVALVVLVVAAACSSSATASLAGSGAPPGPAGSPAAGAQGCAWPEEVDAYSANTVIPDTSAAYWIDRFPVAPGLRIVLSGTFPDARYASLQVYTAAGSPFTRNGVGSALTDYQIAPDQGSVNPWQQRADAGGHFTVTLSADVAPGQVNTIPLAPAGTTSGRGLLVYRIYLPAGGDVSKIELPSLTVEQAGRSESLAPCTSFYSPLTAPQSASLAAPTATPTATPSPAATTRAVGQLQFFRATIETLAPNVDTPYLLAYLVPPGPDDVVVIRGKALTHASGDHPSPWPAAGEDVRYWSLCIALATGVVPTVMNLLPSGGIDTGCRADEQTTLDAAGDYAFVLGTEAQRDAILGVADTTFLPFSAAQPATTHLLMFRDMLVDPSFASSPGRVTLSNDPAATAAVMGSYYPRATICPLGTLVGAGVSGCFK
jgi:hypothetical protein